MRSDTGTRKWGEGGTPPTWEEPSDVILDSLVTLGKWLSQGSVPQLQAVEFLGGAGWGACKYIAGRESGISPHYGQPSATTRQH